MSKQIRLVCEGDMDCTNPVFLTKEQVMEHNKESKVICCPDCKPTYGKDFRANPLSMNEFKDDIDKPSNPEEPV